MTVTAPPLGPLLCDALGVVLDGDEAGLLADPDAPDAPGAPDAPAAAAELMPAGTEVAFGPSSTSTWPAATAELGLAVTPV